MEILVQGQLDYFEEKSWKKRYFVMKFEISSALRYIEIYKDKNWQKQLPRHVVNLHPGYEVRRREEAKKKHCFSVKTTDHMLLLASEDENVITHWMATLEEYNLVKSFCVQPQDTPTMVKIEAVFPCHLQLVHSEVRLVSAMDGKLLGLWPFKCIRRYKFVGNLFSIEAGRKAPTGEGIFEFVSNECAEIYRVMDTIIRTKAGNTTMRRLASEKLHNQVEQGFHLPIRKTLSVPVSPSKREPQYDYADPAVSTTVTKPPPPPIPLPNPPPPPIGNPPELPPEKTEPTYDVLSPGIEGTINEFDARFTNQSEPAANESEYNTLQFANTQQVECNAPVSNRKPTMAGSPGGYDTLRFDTSPDTTSSGYDFVKGKAKNGNYDTLQFGAKRNTLSHPVEDAQTTKNDSELPHSSGSFYNTLDHASSSHSVSSVPCTTSITSNTYDTLDAGNTSPSGGANTYDCLANTTHEVKPPTSLDLDNTYDTVEREPPKPTGKSSPVKVVSPQRPSAPVKPPPRKKAPSIPKQHEPPMRKICAAGKPEKPARKNVLAKENKEERKQSIDDVIQKRLAMPQPIDDGSYSSVDHEYAAIDYSAVSRSESTDSSDIYTDPDQDDTRETAATKPSTKPSKPTRNPPRPGKSLFKKSPPGPKPKLGTEGNFADELKKKLEIKLQKTGGHKNLASIPIRQPDNDDIYCEVDESTAPTYSEPYL